MSAPPTAPVTPHKKKWVQTWVDNGGGYITLAGGPVEGQP